MKIRLEGLDTLSRALKQKSQTSTKSLQRVIRKHGAGLQQKAKRMVPVDTRTLKRSITLDINFSGLTATVEPQAEYAPYVEYGTRFMDAQPYMRPAYFTQVAQLKADLDNLVK